MTYQSNPLYAAIHAAEFPAQAILRLRSDLQAQPVAILGGIAPQERVCSLNLHAKQLGAAIGMTRLEIEELNVICVLARSLDSEFAAHSVLLECVSTFSPRVEETIATNTCGFVLDISGSERLLGPPEAIARSLHSAIASAGFRASVSISHNFHVARICAAFMPGINIVPTEQEAHAIASIPIASLQLDQLHEETFVLWGIRTLGELAELPEEELISRLGQQAKLWLKLSRGKAEHTFLPIDTKFELKEHIEFETHVEQLDSLLFIGANMINNLVSRAMSRALSLANLTVYMSLEKQLSYERIIRPAIPTSDRKFLLKLLQLEIAAHPPQAAITSLTLIAEAGQQSKVQLGLFAPQTPETSRLDVALSRLKALVGDERVGSPVLRDSHHSGSFDIDNFAIPNQSVLRINIAACISLRRIRPPHPLRIQLNFKKPSSFRDGAYHYKVQAAYGPWQSSGCWWSVDMWNTEEWDVKAINNLGEVVGCLIIHDYVKDKWMLEAFYD
ncbi:DNA polymerase Y family protein [Telmatobacter sp. DSM 110680]|uniref:DNA polymerase Y family protein n=1 Tax=Telmatobacter sp. DSM 110680 TaxID=3036704 RepID=A0AAU7DDT4_9BACT